MSLVCIKLSPSTLLQGVKGVPGDISLVLGVLILNQPQTHKCVHCIHKEAILYYVGFNTRHYMTFCLYMGGVKRGKHNRSHQTSSNHNIIKIARLG